MAPPSRLGSSQDVPPVPADADLTWSSDHELWGPIRCAAWRDGRLFELSDEGAERRWHVPPARVQGVIAALTATRFWEWKTQGMPVPDEEELELRVRTAEGVRAVSLWSHDWQSGPAARCQQLVVQLFETAPDNKP